MNVAVISNGTQQGKTSFVMMLATIFSRTQHRKVAVFRDATTEDVGRMVDLSQVNGKSDSKSVNIFRAMLESATLSGDEYYDYALRIGNEEAFLFDIYNSSLEISELDEVFYKTVKRIKSDLNLIEVTGDLSDERTKKILEFADVILYVFNHDRKGLDMLNNYIKEYDYTYQRKTGYVCQKFEKEAVSDKQVAKEIGMNRRNILFIPYNPVIIKESLDGTLDLIAKDVATGLAPVINLRMGFLEVMQYLFDSARVKYIKGVNEWYK